MPATCLSPEFDLVKVRVVGTSSVGTRNKIIIQLPEHSKGYGLFRGYRSDHLISKHRSNADEWNC